MAYRFYSISRLRNSVTSPGRFHSHAFVFLLRLCLFLTFIFLIFIKKKIILKS